MVDNIESDRRNMRFCIALLPSEMTLINLAAQAHALPASGWVRSVVIDKIRSEMPKTAQ